MTRFGTGEHQTISQAREFCTQDESANSLVDPAQATAPIQTLPVASWKEASIASYLSFTSADKGEMNPWISMVLEPKDRANDDCIFFEEALAAVGLQRMSKWPHLDGMRQKAVFYHSRALRQLSTALTKASVVASDQSLLAVRLLITYARCDSSISKAQRIEEEAHAGGTSLTGHAMSTGVKVRDPPHPDPGTSLGQKPAMPVIDSHLDGLLFLVLARGPRQLQTDVPRRLYQSVRENIIHNYSARCIRLPVSKEQPQWQWFFYTSSTDPADGLNNIVTDLPQLRHRAWSLCYTVDPVGQCQECHDVKADAYVVLERLQDWHRGLPHDWSNPCIVPVAANEPERWKGCDHPSVSHLYPDPMVTMVIGRYQVYSIMLLQAIATSVLTEIEYDLNDRLLDPDCPLTQEYNLVVARQQVIVDAICAELAVYSLREDTFYELGKPIPAGGLQHGGHFMPVILTSQSVQSVCTRQRRYLAAKMDELLGFPRGACRRG